MYRVIGFLDSKRVIKCNMLHLPRVGDVVDLNNEDIQGLVTRITWFIKMQNVSPDYVPTQHSVLMQMNSILTQQGE